jgi:hypothetical protein
MGRHPHFARFHLRRLLNPTTEEPTESSRGRTIGIGGTLAIISSIKKTINAG